LSVRFLYTVIAYLLAPLFCAALLWRGQRGSRRNFSERFGFGSALGEPGIWVHAVSVGEVQAAQALVHSLLQHYPKIPLVVTTLTSTGQQRARALFGDKVLVRYFPLDLPGSVRRFLDRIKPRIAVILETELWPNLYRECERRGVPLLLASARISPRSVRRYRRMAGLFRDTLSRGIVVAAQGEGDADRFRSIGSDAARTHVTGNIKFDITLPPDVAARGRQLREFHAKGHSVWVAGSTHGGEEQIVLEAHRLVRQRNADALLVLAPRHPNRFAEAAEWLTREGVRFVKHSQGIPCEARTEVLLVDTLGELLNFYAAADVAFVGGSLVPIGGHNLLEPAALGLPVLTGPNNLNSEDIARLLVERGGARIVHDAGELGQNVVELFEDAAARARLGALARACVEDNRGALNSLMKLIAPFIR